jgi:hypothetical protein
MFGSGHRRCAARFVLGLTRFDWGLTRFDWGLTQLERE